jgi:LCP family protein required for cell wall assembly
VAAVISFLFPGLGHAYLGRKREALTFAVPVLVLFLLLLVWLISSGITRAGAKLLVPSIAGLAAVISLIVVVWWAAAIVSAWRAGYHSFPATVAVPIALVGILVVASIGNAPLGPAWLYNISVADHGFGNGRDCTIQDCGVAGLPTPQGSLQPLPSTIGTPQGSPAPGDTTQPDTSATDDPYNDYGNDPSEPPATPVPGATPGFDIRNVDAHDDGWLNVLLVGLDTRCAGGIATGSHTDTMIVASVNSDTGDLYMFSFPRDTAQFPLYTGGTMPGYWKLNTFAGYTKSYPDLFPTPGQPALAYEIGYLLGAPIDYYASINICGFPQLIDTLGGVNVCVAKAIDDPSYPWGDGRVGVHIDAGQHHFDGATALAYARSRHGSSDFARAKRQQQLLTAVRQSVLQPSNLQNLPNIITAMSDVVHTDFPPDQFDQLLSLASQVNGAPTGQYVFDFPTWAQHLPRTDTNGRSVQFLDIDKIAALSRQIYGDKSLYPAGQPVPTAGVTQPSSSDAPDAGATQC